MEIILIYKQSTSFISQSMHYTKLNNPVWHSLNESHKNVAAINSSDVKFYHPDYCPFGGVTKTTGITNHLHEYASMIDQFYVVGERPELSNQLMLVKELVCCQMIIAQQIDWLEKENIVALTDEHGDALFQLVNLVQPGYFKTKTALLGNYFGIFKNGELVAAAGERMQMNDFVEVSAIVTHPDHVGQGFAKQLTAHVVNAIFNQNKTPFLHVLETNVAAIALYEKLGFRTRRKISFWQIKKLE
jgi:GNAT superfamily N-acetyltransferase